MDEHDKCLVGELHEDTLVAALRRLPPRDLAASRCFCKAWRAAIEGGRLLRAKLLPLSLSGIFVDFNMLGRTEFFSPSSSSCGGGGGASATVSGDLDYTPDISVKGHCNSLVLLFSCVANPATRQWADLPEQPPPRTATEDAYYEVPHLVFDPTLSPSYYEVFLIPVVPHWAIKHPVGLEPNKHPELHLGRSENGVYCAVVELRFRLRVWILEESSGRMEWVLKHQNNLEHLLRVQSMFNKIMDPGS